MSTATVSRVLNGEEHVSEELTERVWAASRKLGYRPNLNARRLRRPERRTWALILPDIGNRFFTRVARGVELVASEHGITVFIGNTDNDPDRLERYLDTAIDEQVAGVILAPGSPDDDVSMVLAAGIPLVTVDATIEGLNLDAVMSDDFAGGRLAGELLLRRGHRRIGVVASPQDAPSWNQHIDGLAAALGDRAEIVAVERGDNQVGGGMSGMHSLLDRHPDLDAVFVTNNLMTLGAYRAITDRGLTVPADIDLVGYDLRSEEWALTAPVSAVNQDPQMIGEVAARLMLERELGADNAGELRLLEPQLEDPPQL